MPAYGAFFFVVNCPDLPRVLKTVHSLAAEMHNTFVENTVSTDTQREPNEGCLNGQTLARNATVHFDS